MPHRVLNARHDEAEAAIVARAGERGQVTISTNMAGRGTDIRLGEGVAELGGLYVIGTNLVSLTTIDDLWSEYLSALSDFRGGVQWVSLAGGGRDPLQDFYRFGGFDPFREFIRHVDELFEELLAAIDSEIPVRLQSATVADGVPSRRGTTWTYITTDQPFGTWMQSALQEFIKRKIQAPGRHSGGREQLGQGGELAAPR